MMRAFHPKNRIILSIFGLILGMSMPGLAQQAEAIHNSALTISVRAQDGSYEILASRPQPPMLVSRIAAQIDRRWIRSTDYPHHQILKSTFQDALGSGHTLQTTFSGLKDRPDLICTLRLYDHKPYGDVSVQVRNTTAEKVSVQAIRVADALGEPRINLGGQEESDWVLAETFSENPLVQIGGLSLAPHGDYYGFRSELIYNQQSHQNLLLAALTEERFLTALHLKVEKSPSGTLRVASFTVDSTGTTEAVNPIFSQIPPAQQIVLSLPVAPGESLSSERVMFEAGEDYYSELEEYGAAIRLLHHARVSSPNLIGWWSWTAFYDGITEGDVLTNAQWLAQHLKSFGYNWFHIDAGYEYARGEYTTANAVHFPHGMRSVGHAICNLGLKFGIWTAPFEVSARASIYAHHPEWLVRDAQGKPINIGSIIDGQDPLYVLDTTHPGAQAYLQETYRTLTREWGVGYIKLDFMDATAVEGYRYRANTTGLEALRIGLKIIRQAVGDDVLLDKDGSPMLNPVGLVDEGRISIDTGHDFIASKDALWNIAARFYMNRNFYINDPDAFAVSGELIPQEDYHQSKTPLTLNVAQVQIVLAALAGGMYEIGDDLPTLGSDPERVSLVENQELIDMIRLGRAALPLDLMTFLPADKQPSVFLLREDRRQAMLAIFNWTEQPRSHTFALGDLKLPADHPYDAFDVLNHDAPFPLDGGTLQLQAQPPHSVRLIKLIDTSVPAAAPTVTGQVPSAARGGEVVNLFASAEGSEVPALSFHWDFGDGTEAQGQRVTHTYTRPSTFAIELTVAGIDGNEAHKCFTITVTGYPNAVSHLQQNRR